MHCVLCTESKMQSANFSSESDSDSDFELLCQLSDWDDGALSSSSDDEGPITKDAIVLRSSSHCVSHKNYGRTNYMQSLNDGEFTYRFRLNKAAVEILLMEIMPYVKVTSKRNNGVAPLHQLLLTLRFYALGTMLISVADYVGVSKSSASRIVQNISEAIAMLYNKYVVVHQDSADKFYRIAQFPRVLGVIDSTHIRIQTTNHIESEEFRHPKGYFSLNVQAVCDKDLKFMNVIARWPGAAHKATIFDHSGLRAQCEDGTYGNRWLLGDCGYPNRSYLLTPLSSPANERELRYNRAHELTRSCITRAIGLWKRRFPVIALSLRLALRNIQTVIIATAVLHNVCVRHNVERVEPEAEAPADHVEDSGALDVEQQDFVQRTRLIDDFFSDKQ